MPGSVKEMLAAANASVPKISPQDAAGSDRGRECPDRRRARRPGAAGRPEKSGGQRMSRAGCSSSAPIPK